VKKFKHFNFMKKLLLLRPDVAFSILYLIPTVVFVISILIGSLFHLILFSILSFTILGLQLIYIFIWRLYVGNLIYQSLPNHITKGYKTHLFFNLSILIYFPGIFILFMLTLINHTQIFIYVIAFFMITVLPVTYFQCYYIAKNISILYNNKLLIKEFWPINWMTIGFYPMNAYRIHKVLIEIFESRPTPNTRYSQ
jgi:hypothetical protein